MSAAYFRILGVILLLAFPAISNADHCPRGALSPHFCDHDGDLLADPPRDKRELKDPSTLVFTYTPVENPPLYAQYFAPLTEHLSRCLQRPVIFYQVQSDRAELEAIKHGKLHLGGFATGATIDAVNQAGAIPFAARGDKYGIQGYHALVITLHSSGIEYLKDLRGREVAHTHTNSNAGHFAPLALLPPLGIEPGKDYSIHFSGKHDRSIKDLLAGKYDAAVVASDIFERMIARGQIQREDFRILYQSPAFPSSAFAYAHDLSPHFKEQLSACIFEFRFPKEMQAVFNGADRLVPVNYKEDWEAVRRIRTLKEEISYPSQEQKRPKKLR